MKEWVGTTKWAHLFVEGVRLEHSQLRYGKKEWVPADWDDVIEGDYGDLEFRIAPAQPIEEEEEEEKNEQPPKQRMMGQPHCPKCFTFGYTHRIGCVYEMDGMDRHIRNGGPE